MHHSNNADLSILIGKEVHQRSAVCPTPRLCTPQHSRSLAGVAVIQRVSLRVKASATDAASAPVHPKKSVSGGF